MGACNKEDDPEPTPIRDYATQYSADMDAIKKYLKTHSYTVDANQNVTFTIVPELSASSIWGSDAANHKPEVLELSVDLHNITYTVYYLKLTEGTGNKPCNYDSVLAAYKGELMDGTDTQAATVFDQNQDPQSYFNLATTIKGWQEIFPKFKTGTYASNPDGTISYSNFGAGVMFLPSGLAYYSNATTNIPSYSPLIFSFKLYEIQRNDHDLDGIYSYLEDVNGDGYLRNTDDTDGDGTPNFLDVDDDGDSYLTKNEIKKNEDGTITYYDTDLDLIPDYLDSNSHPNQ